MFQIEFKIEIMDKVTLASWKLHVLDIYIYIKYLYIFGVCR